MNDDMHKDEDEEAPIAALRGLNREVQPQRDLWPGIEARLVRRRRFTANGWMSLAAAACVLAITGLAVLEPQRSVAPPPAETAVLPPAPDLAAVPGSRALVKANLQLARSSAVQIRRALQQDPDSPALRRLLLTTESRSDELRRMLAAQAT